MKQNGINLTEEEQKQLNSMSFSKVTRINPKVLNPKIVRRGKKIYKAKREASIWSLIKDIYKSASDNERKLIKQGVFWSITKGTITGIMPMVMGNMMTALQNAASTAKWWGCGCVGSMAMEGVSNIYQSNTQSKINQQIRANATVRKFKEILGRPIQFFRLKDNNARNMQSRISNIAMAQAAIMKENLQILTGVTGIAVSGAVLLASSPVMCGIVCGGTAMTVGIRKFLISRFRRPQEIIRGKSEQTNSTIHDLSSKTDVLKRYNQKDKSINIVDHSLNKHNLFFEVLSKLSTKLNFVMASAVNIGVFGAACYIGSVEALNSGHLGMYMTIVGGSMGFLGHSMRVSQSLSQMKEYVNQYIDENKKLQIPHRMNIKSGEKQLLADNSKIEVKNVSFEYPDYSEKKDREDKDSSKKKNSFRIDNMNATFEKGKLQVIIGESGNGKSTLTDLITHVYDVDGGEITIGGVNIAETTEQEIMDYVGIMTQKDVFLDTMSIRENMNMLVPDEDDLEVARIKMEKGEISEERYNYMCELHDHPQQKIDEALKKARIYDTYYQEQPNGELNCEKGFAEFSGGEQQRLTFARALLAQKEIIILDEPTSALDAGLSMELVAELKEAAKDKNIIVVTHAADIVANADKVTVVEKGKITGDDNVFELLRSNDYFKKNYSIPTILEARKKYLKCAGKETYEIEQKILFQQKIDTAYSELKTELEHNPKEFINKIKGKVKSFHESGKADDADLMVMKKVLDTPEMQKAYVSASKEVLKKRRYANNKQRN